MQYKWIMCTEEKRSKKRIYVPFLFSLLTNTTSEEQPGWGLRGAQIVPLRSGFPPNQCTHGGLVLRVLAGFFPFFFPGVRWVFFNTCCAQLGKCRGGGAGVCGSMSGVSILRAGPQVRALPPVPQRRGGHSQLDGGVRGLPRFLQPLLPGQERRGAAGSSPHSLHVAVFLLKFFFRGVLMYVVILFTGHLSLKILYRNLAELPFPFLVCMIGQRTLIRGSNSSQFDSFLSKKSQQMCAPLGATLTFNSFSK